MINMLDAADRLKVISSLMVPAAVSLVIEDWNSFNSVLTEINVLMETLTSFGKEQQHD